ncbi:SDR family NAD(P)-dependent oxidoreductase [Pseudomonas sp. NY15354]|uniref:SDR family NAD(P)-dependent oxidoreductase n=1 Tax=Pseudomonas sp. NY15354 TaxID=3400351 RepID=UPI003A8AB7D6
MTFAWKKGAPRVVFITGGGSGIGREFARRLAQEGGSVAIFNRRLAPTVVEELQTLARSPSQRFSSFAADVMDEAALRHAFAEAAAQLGSPQLIINSAGIIVSSPFAELSADDFERVVRVNLIGSRNTSAAALPYLSPGSHLVLVASLAGLLGNYGYAAYSASKFGVVGLARVLDIELSLLGVDVSVCCPGVILTPMVQAEHEVEHPLTRALAEFPGVLDVETACRGMLRGIARRRFEIGVGLLPRLTAWGYRHAPGFMRPLSHLLTRWYARRLRTR